MATTVQLTPDQAANSDGGVSKKIVVLKICNQLEYPSYWLKMNNENNDSLACEWS